MSFYRSAWYRKTPREMNSLRRQRYKQKPQIWISILFSLNGDRYSYNVCKIDYPWRSEKLNFVSRWFFSPLRQNVFQNVKCEVLPLYCWMFVFDASGERYNLQPKLENTSIVRFSDLNFCLFEQFSLILDRNCFSIQFKYLQLLVLDYFEKAIVSFEFKK